MVDPFRPRWPTKESIEAADQKARRTRLIEQYVGRLLARFGYMHGIVPSWYIDTAKIFADAVIEATKDE